MDLVSDRVMVAPDGEFTCWNMIVHAVRSASKFIYVEDQYLVSREIAFELAAKLQQKDFELLVILACSTDLADLPQIRYRRKNLSIFCAVLIEITNV